MGGYLCKGDMYGLITSRNPDRKEMRHTCVFLAYSVLYCLGAPKAGDSA